MNNNHGIEFIKVFKDGEVYKITPKTRQEPDINPTTDSQEPDKDLDAPEEESTVDNDLTETMRTSFLQKLRRVGKVSAYIKFINCAIRDCERLITSDIPEPDRNEMFDLIDQIERLITKLSKIYINHKYPKSQEETQEKKVGENDK